MVVEGGGQKGHSDRHVLFDLYYYVCVPLPLTHNSNSPRQVFLSYDKIALTGPQAMVYKIETFGDASQNCLAGANEELANEAADCVQDVER